MGGYPKKITERSHDPADVPVHLGASTNSIYMGIKEADIEKQPSVNIAASALSQDVIRLNTALNMSQGT